MDVCVKLDAVGLVAKSFLPGVQTVRIVDRDAYDPIDTLGLERLQVLGIGRHMRIVAHASERTWDAEEDDLLQIRGMQRELQDRFFRQDFNSAFYLLASKELVITVMRKLSCFAIVP